MASIDRRDVGKRPWRLLPGELRRALVLEAYYIVLLKDDAFRAEFHRLFALASLPPWSITENVEPPGDAALAMADFVERWHLPTDHGVADVWNSFSLAARGAEPLMLWPGPRSWMGPISEKIEPTRPAAIEYDPTHDSLDSIRQRAKEAAAAVERDIVSQAEEIERRARAMGFTEVPPLHRDPEHCRQMAMRLYRRAVLGQSWQKIAHEEGVEIRAIRDSVGRWASELKIPLKR